MTIINDILDFSRIEAGKLELDQVGFNLHGNLQQSVKTLALRAHEKGLELAFDIKSRVPRYVVGDGERLRQIVINLIGNAIKFIKHREIELVVDLTESQQCGQVELHFLVRDTGIG